MMMGNRVSKWSDATIQKSVMLKYKLGDKFYKETFVKKMAPFPSRTSILRHLQSFKISPGILNFNIKVLGEKMKKIPLEHRSIGLVFDEKAIIPSSQYDKSSKEYVGLVTLLPSEAIQKKEGNEIKAKNALVVLAVGMNVREKEIVGLHYTAGCTDGNALKDFLFSIITTIESTEDVFVDWVGFDIGPSNQSFLNACGVALTHSNKEFYVSHPVRAGSFLFLKPDDVHNKKNFISALRKNDFKMASSLVDMFHLNSNKVTFKEVSKIYNQQKKSDMKPAKKLKQECLKPNNFETMHEYVAYEIFSSDVLAAINFNDEDAESNGKRNATAAFLQILNIFHKITSDSEGWCSDNMEKFEIDIEFLKWFVDDFLANVKTPTSLRCLPAMCMSIRSLIAMSTMYFEKGYKKVIPARFLSNAIENIFSIVTSIFKKPTAASLAQALKIISMRQFEFDPTTINYGWDETISPSINFIALLKDFIQKEMESSNDFEMQEEEEEIEESIIIQIQDEISSEQLFDTDMSRNVFYLEMSKILSCVLKTISCEVCKKILVDDTSQETANNRLFREHQNIIYSSFDLPYLSRNIERYFNRLEFIFQSVSSLIPVQSQNFKKTFLINADNVLVPYEHCYSTSSKIITTYLTARLKLRLHSYMPHKAIKHSSKSLI